MSVAPASHPRLASRPRKATRLRKTAATPAAATPAGARPCLLDDAQLEAIARLFQMLADPSRLRILQLLKQRPHTVSALVAELEIGQAAVSKQLGLLHQASLVSRRRAGLHVHYAIAEPMIFDLCELVCGKFQRDAVAAAATWK